MKRVVGLGGLVAVGIVVAACSGSEGATGATGATGPKGDPGTSATGSPSVSAISPPYAFQARTVDLTIAGAGTTWDANTTVAFAASKITVNKVTVASASGLLVNVTLAADAPVGATDVTVTDGTSTSVYKGAFEVKAPLVVTSDPTAGVPQGGLANLHVVMADLTTPFDPDTLNVTLSSPDVATSEPSPTDYAFDLTIEADILATPGAFDLDVTSGSPSTIDSSATQAFKIVARAPTTLTATSAGAGNIETELDTELYSFTPASASQEFVQFTVSSNAGEVAGTVIPKSGKYADAIVTDFAVRYGQGTTSTNLLYVVVSDSESLFGAGPVPADSKVVAFESSCTAAAELTETAADNDDTFATAQVITTLPALVSGTLGYGSVDPTLDVDVYEITVTGAQTIHAATGGDPEDDTILMILDGTGTVVATSADDDYQEDLTYSATAGTYYVQVTPSVMNNFSAADNTYQLFIDAK